MEFIGPFVQEKFGTTPLKKRSKKWATSVYEGFYVCVAGEVGGFIYTLFRIFWFLLVFVETHGGRWAYVRVT